MELRTIIGILFLFQIKVGEASRVPLTDQQHLVNTIFETYDKTLRPIEDTDSVTNVTLNPALYSILKTDEAAECIVIVQSFRMIWKDIFLSWDPSEFGGMKQLMIPINRIWYPDITFLNLIEMTIVVPEDNNYARINYDGTVLTTIDEVVTLHCKYYINMFPFDVQNCTMHAGSWMHTGEQMDIFYSTPTDLDQYNNNTEWELISFTARKEKAYYVTTESTWVDIYYDIVIQRKPTYYLLTFVLPCFIITSISIIGIFAPFNDSGDREEKVTMGLTTMLTMAIILTIITDKMPRTSEGMPLMAMYIMLQVAIAAANSFVAVFILYQQRKWTNGEPVPGWIRVITFLTLRKVKTGTKTRKTNNSSHYYGAKEPAIDIHAPLSEHMKQQLMVMNEMRGMMQQITEHIYDQEVEERLRKDWQRAAHRLDLIAMLLFLAFNLAVTLAFLVIGYLH
uniref:Uncharacterized protein n=1 Tax=Plectus sambesii TaxID=2011161 RepID=A0A914ULY4_9BILA